MKDIEDGGQAFPSPPFSTGDPRDGISVGCDGMTMRDWFAGQYQVPVASDGRIVYTDVSEARVGKVLGLPKPTEPGDIFLWRLQIEARIKFLHANYMIEERNKP